MIELLVVVAIIGILAAVAIPQFRYQAKAFDARVVSDVKNAATAQETFWVDNQKYSSACATLPGFIMSAGVTFSQCTATDSTFLMTTTHPQTTKTCTWDSTASPPMSCS